MLNCHDSFFTNPGYLLLLMRHFSIQLFSFALLSFTFQTEALQIWSFPLPQWPLMTTVPYSPGTSPAHTSTQRQMLHSKLCRMSFIRSCWPLFYAKHLIKTFMKTETNRMAYWRELWTHPFLCQFLESLPVRFQLTSWVLLFTFRADLALQSRSS